MIRGQLDNIEDMLSTSQPPLLKLLTINLQTSNMFVQSYKHSHTLIQTLFVKHILNNEELYTNTTTDNQTWFVQTPFVANFFGDHTPSNIKPQTCVCANYVWNVWGCFFVWQNVWKFLIKLKKMITNMNKWCLRKPCLTVCGDVWNKVGLLSGLLSVSVKLKSSKLLLIRYYYHLSILWST